MSGKPASLPWSSLPQSRVLRKLYQIYGRLVTDRFHKVYYATADTWYRNTYFGHKVYQFPGDLWLYQELVARERPACIVQTGVAFGGSVLYFAHLLDLIGAGPQALVIGVDLRLSPEARGIDHPRLRLIEGDSVAPATVRQVERLLPPAGGLVSLDSDHSCDHVLRELAIYSRYVSVGAHLVVEDTNINGHPVWPGHGPGPYEAVRRFLRGNRQFVRDDTIWRRNLFSFHRHGWLVRVG